MEDIKINIAHNLTELRKKKKITQSELAAKFAYSDKAVSKWENAETIPAVDTLEQLADFYGVTIDYLVHEATPENKTKYAKTIPNSVNKTVITGLAVLLVWLLAVVVAIGTQWLMKRIYWMAFVWAIPVSFLIMLIFNAVWGKHKWSASLITLFAWTLLGSLYLEIGLDLPDQSGWKLWILLLLGVPITAAAILSSHLKTVSPAE
jgi:DNA-binding XRE family transcriptional regulator